MVLYICSSIFTHFSSIFASFLLHFGDDLADFGGLARDLRKTSKSAPFRRPLGDHLGAKMRQVGAKIAPSWPTWRQDVPKMANLEGKMPNLAHFWEHLGDFFCILGAILLKMTKTKKRRQYITFEGFLGSWGCSWRLCWAIFALCWAILALCWLILALC